MEAKVSKKVKVNLKDNQIALHHAEYDVSFLVEINATDKGVEFTYVFDPEINGHLDTFQKDKIAEDSLEELKALFSLTLEE